MERFLSHLTQSRRAGCALSDINRPAAPCDLLMVCI